VAKFAAWGAGIVIVRDAGVDIVVEGLEDMMIMGGFVGAFEEEGMGGEGRACQGKNLGDDVEQGEM
jgi:hypothetical protein